MLPFFRVNLHRHVGYPWRSPRPSWLMMLRNSTRKFHSSNRNPRNKRAVSARARRTTLGIMSLLLGHADQVVEVVIFGQHQGVRLLRWPKTW